MKTARQSIINFEISYVALLLLHLATSMSFQLESVSISQDAVSTQLSKPEKFACGMVACRDLWNEFVILLGVESLFPGRGILVPRPHHLTGV